MKKRLSYFVSIVNNCGFYADVENKQTCIELSNIDFRNGSFQFDSPEKLRNYIVGKYHEQYSNPDERTKEGRKEIALQLAKRIAEMKDQIDEFKLVIQMCKKNAVKIKP